MEKQFSISPKFKLIPLGLVAIGFLTFFIGLFINPEKTWANFLLNDYYFISVVIGATFFLSLQYITQSGWSALFIRIPHAIGTYLPVAAVLTIILVFGMQSLYHWAIPGAGEYDPIVNHKTPYLNVSFFFVRIFIVFGIWILMTSLMRKNSLKEDREGGLKYFHKSEQLSKIYIFILAITFSLTTFDLIMSIDVHWSSTIFAVMNFVSGFYHSIAVITLILLILNRKGHFINLNDSHLNDFSKYIFRLAIIWAYLWFVQYLLIWFTNIPEETIYYVKRTQGEWKILFFLNFILNFAIPFLILLPQQTNSKKMILTIVSLILVIGQWIDLYVQIMPGVTGRNSIGIIEIGTFIGFVGLFIYTIQRTFNKLPLIPVNHPYLEESIKHQIW